MNVERFWAKVDKVSGPVHAIHGRCWQWTASLTGPGYGQACLGNHRTGLAHRVSWALERGPIPTGAWVLHRCDNRACVNPAHLFLGDAQSNVDDMHAKGRAVSGFAISGGGRRNRAKLTERDRAQIVELAKGGMRRPEIAAALGGKVQPSAVSKVITGRTWAHRDRVAKNWIV